MNRVMLALILLSAVVNLSACSHQSIQEAYWGAGTSVALSDEKKRNTKKAETELQVALARATSELNEAEARDWLKKSSAQGYPAARKILRQIKQ